MYRRLLILLALSGMVQAKNLGTWGEMYPIVNAKIIGRFSPFLMSAIGH